MCFWCHIEPFLFGFLETCTYYIHNYHVKICVFLYSKLQLPVANHWKLVTVLCDAIIYVSCAYRLGKGIIAIIYDRVIGEKSFWYFKLLSDI